MVNEATNVAANARTRGEKDMAANETERTHKDGSVLGHVFERAQLGRAPFKFVGIIERTHNGAAGGFCHYCGTGIRYCYVILSADGKRFEVGSDCVAHLGDTKLVAVVMSAERQRKNAQARERARVKRQAEEAERAAEVERRMPEYVAALEVLAARPHPTDYFAAQGKTLADYFRYFERGGRPTLWKLQEAVAKATAR